MLWTQTSQSCVVLWFHLCLNNARALLWQTERKWKWSLLGGEYLDHLDEVGLWAAWISLLFKWARRKHFWSGLHIGFGRRDLSGCHFFCLVWFWRLISLMLRRHLWLVLVSWSCLFSLNFYCFEIDLSSLSKRPSLLSFKCAVLVSISKLLPMLDFCLEYFVLTSILPLF